MSRTSTDLRPIVAVDFDGTITAKNDYTGFTMDAPLKRGCAAVMQRLKSRGVIFILWTCRSGSKLEEAIEYCSNHGIPIDYVNENVPWLIEAWGNDCRKIYADYYVDDLNYDKSSGGIDWYEVESFINGDMFFKCKNCFFFTPETHRCERISDTDNELFDMLGIPIKPKVDPNYGCKKFRCKIEED